jgi:hypothetical protein
MVFTAPVFSWHQSFGTDGKVTRARTECCGTLINVKQIVRYEFTPYIGDETEDEWGNPAKPKQ